MQSMMALDLAHQLMRERRLEADRDALADMARRATTQARSQAPHAAQLWLAQGLRRLAIRLDPSVVCEPTSPAVAIAR